MKEYRQCKNIGFKYTQGKTDIFGRMFHDYYEIYLLLEGDVEFINNHTRQKIKPFQVVIIKPGEYHQFVVSGNKENYKRCVIDIYPDFFETHLLENAFSGKELLSLTESDRIIKNFLYLTECLSSVSNADFQYILPAITTDIIFLIKNCFDAQTLFSGSLCNLSINLMNYLNEHFANPLDLEFLAGKFYCSVSSLCHIFKKDFGISIKKYIIQKRITASNMALQKGEKPEEVCIKYGFTNYSTFYRDYKKHFGVPPSKTPTKKDV